MAISLVPFRRRILVEIEQALAPWRRPLASGATLSEVEDRFLRLFTHWEGFQSDWFIAAVSLDTSVLKGKIETSLDQQLRGKYSLGLTPQVRLSKELSFTDAQALLDKEGQNLTFANLDSFAERAQTEICAPLAARASVAANVHNAAEVLNSARTIRNWLAHRSTSSSREMNASLTNQPVAALRRTAVGRVAVYLQATMAGPGVPLALRTVGATAIYDRTRMVLYCTYMARAAWQLCP